jgi:hypothetical protein
VKPWFWIVNILNWMDEKHARGRRSSAVATALTTWEMATGEGIRAGVARVARAALLWERDDDLAKHAEQATVDRLARAWMAHARAFLASDDLAPARHKVSVPDPLVGGDGWSADTGWTIYPRDPRLVGIDCSAWLDERDREIPASVVDGVPWLSARLADYLRRELGVHGAKLADDWIKREREREADLADQLLIPGCPPPPLLPGWSTTVDVPGLAPAFVPAPPDLPDGPTPPDRAAWFVSAAALNLALAVWWAEVRPALEAERERERDRYPVSGLLEPVARAHPGTMLGPGGAWQVNAVDAGILDQLHRSGALETSAAAALWQRLPDLARIAANNQGRRVTVWEGEEGAVLASITTGQRTEIEIRGGYQALAACLGLNGGDARTALRATATGLAKIPLRWWAAGGSEGITSLLGDLNEHPGRVTFILPRMLWPGFAAELRDLDHAREERRRVPVAPDLPPTTNARLGAGPARLEVRGMVWIRDHLDQIEGIAGAPVPWNELAEEVGLSEAKQPARRRTALAALLELWVERRRWHRTGDLWRPDYGWSGPGSLLEALEQRKGGQQAQAKRAKTRR